MRFFDCNVYYGIPPTRQLRTVSTAEELLAEMDYNGVEKALVWHTAQMFASVQRGNQLIAEGIKPHPRLYGCWSILPASAPELPKPEVFFQQMKENHIAAVRVFPGQHNFLFHPLALDKWLEQLTVRRIPLIVSLARGTTWQSIYTVLQAFPDLVCLICDHGVWGQDRFFRPLLEHFPNVYIDTSIYLLDGGLEAIVQDFGSCRILFGSGFPDLYIGGMMLAIKHAEISQEDRDAIAYGNLERILTEAKI